MGSFSNPHYMFLFEMKNGRKKLAYGQSPEDALEILGYRLTPEEMDGVHPGLFRFLSERRDLGLAEFEEAEGRRYVSVRSYLAMKL